MNISNDKRTSGKQNNVNKSKSGSVNENEQQTIVAELDRLRPYIRHLERERKTCYPTRCTLERLRNSNANGNANGSLLKITLL